MKKNFFNYKKIRDKYLLTNDLGRYMYLSKEELYRMLTDQIEEEEELSQRLKEKFFVYDGSEYDFVEKAGNAFSR